MSRFLYPLLTVAVLAPIVYVSVMLFSDYTLFVVILDGVVLAIGATVAYFGWRCPHCKRPFAGTQVGQEQSTTSDSAMVRDTSGVSHSVATHRIRVVRTYRCRHCGQHFYRG